MVYNFTFTIPQAEYTRLYDLIVDAAKLYPGDYGYAGWVDDGANTAYISGSGSADMLRALAVDLGVDQPQIDNLEQTLAAT